LFTCLLSIFYFKLYDKNLNNKIELYQAQERIIVQGVVEDYSYFGVGLPRYTLSVKRINGKKVRSFNCKVYVEDVFALGENILVEGQFKPLSEKSNKSTNYAKEVYGTLTAKNLQIIKDTPLSFDYICGEVRAKLLNKTKIIYDNKTLPIVMAMGYSDKSMLSGSLKQGFRTAGISHALVVSGLHIGIITGAMVCLMSFLPISKKLKNIILAVFLVGYMGVVGFTPSVIRAGVLSVIVLIGRNFLWETDNLTILGCVVLLTALANPYSGADVGLLLSYSACLGVMYAGQVCKNRELGLVVQSLITTVGAVSFTFPILVLFSMEMTLLSPIFNLILSPIIMVICVLSVFTPILGSIGVVGEILNMVLVPLNKAAINILMAAVAFIQENFGFAMVNLSSEVFKVMTFVGLCALAVAILGFKNKKVRINFLFIVLLSTLLCYNFTNKDMLTLTVFDSGKEVSFMVSKGGVNQLILSENISVKRLSEFIYANNLTHFDKVYLCEDEPTGKGAIYEYSHMVEEVRKSQKYKEDNFYLISNIYGDERVYYLGVGGTVIGFSHGGAVIQKPCDFYFFTREVPHGVRAENIYYFTPLLKRQTEAAQDLSAQRLIYDLKIKINTKNHTYKIVKDVLNFGDEL
ncbi:MAG: ComEC/Rec2 family competence protein, partial [Oscillospiraceae bacterium]